MSDNSKLEKYIFFQNNSSNKEAIKSTLANSLSEAIYHFTVLKDLSFGDFLAIYTVEKADD